MPKFSEKVNYCWSKASIIKDKDPTGKKYRLGAARALIKYQDYGLQSELGWDIDHRIKTSFTKNKKYWNIRAMHWKNNQKKGSRLIIDEIRKNQIVYYRELVYDPQKDINIKNNKGMSFTNDIAKDK